MGARASAPVDAADDTALLQLVTGQDFHIVGVSVEEVRPLTALRPPKRSAARNAAATVS
jgi:hypothetical protein